MTGAFRILALAGFGLAGAAAILWAANNWRAAKRRPRPVVAPTMELCELMALYARHSRGETSTVQLLSDVTAFVDRFDGSVDTTFEWATVLFLAHMGGHYAAHAGMHPDVLVTSAIEALETFGSDGR